METITAKNLHSFTPTTQSFTERLDAWVPRIGVMRADEGEGENMPARPMTQKAMRALVHEWNIFSSIGWERLEEQAFALILAEEQSNKRFDGELFIHPKHGGNTGEHPPFIGLQIDKVRHAAGFGADTFDALSPQTLAAAKLNQKLHGMAALHDTGELIDISVGEMRETGASSKEPPEEKLVGPFKIKLACYALSKGEPDIYTDTLRLARARIQRTKDTLLQDAKDKKITGDAFVAGVGKEIAAILEESTASLSAKYGDMEGSLDAEHRALCDHLCAMFDHTLPPDQQLNPDAHATPLDRFEGVLFTLFDKLEGDEHFRHFIGEPATPHTGTTPIAERMYPQGKLNSFHMASSDRVMGGITYAQKMIPQVLEAAAAIPPGPEQDVALAYARAGSVALLRNHIRILQKAPPLVDTSRADKLQPTPADDWNSQVERLRTRYDAWKDLKTQYQPPADPMTEVSGVRTREEMIAVLDTMATAIENGAYVPSKAELPLGIGALHTPVTHADIERCRTEHPCEPFLIGRTGLA